MSKGNSREHHWWPVGLQTYWKDGNGDVSWIEPDGKIDKKRVKNRRVGVKAHGHTMFKGDFWETNFEDEFASADNNIHDVVKHVSGLKPLGYSLTEFAKLVTLLFKRDRSQRETCKFYRLDETDHRSLLLLLFSILIRSPGNRHRYESYPSLMGLPQNETVGKANMHQTYMFAKALCERGYISNQYFVIIHSPYKKFVFGDGCLDWLTSGLVMNRVDGKALVTLTPHLCVYLCTPRRMNPDINCASVIAAPWMVDWINDIVQIYSKKQIFFLGKPPVIKDHFRQGEFLEHGDRSDALIDMLDEIAGIKKQTNLIAFTADL